MKKIVLVLSLMACSQSFADTNNLESSELNFTSDKITKFLVKFSNNYSESLDKMLGLSKALQAKSPTQIEFLGCIEQPLIK